GRVAQVLPRAEGWREPIRDVGASRVRSADLVSEVREEFGDAAHPDSPDSDEVNMPGAAEHATSLPGQLAVAAPGHASASARSTIARAASGRAKPRAARDIASR